MIAAVSIDVDTWPSTSGNISYGSSVILTCSVSENYSANTTFEWKCPNGPCNTSSGESIIIRRVFDSRLVVTVVTPKDEGVYNCTVTNDSGNMTESPNYELSANGRSVLPLVYTCGFALISFLNNLTVTVLFSVRWSGLVQCHKY